MIDIGAVEIQAEAIVIPAAELPPTGANVAGPLTGAIVLFVGGLGLLGYRAFRRRAA